MLSKKKKKQRRLLLKYLLNTQLNEIKLKNE